MRQGYGVFGKAYEAMLKNDLHAAGSIDHVFLQNMIRLDSDSQKDLYAQAKQPDLSAHALYRFAKQFQCPSSKETIKSVLDFTSRIASRYHVPFAQMLFGGTEEQILERGTDWCADMARVGTVLLQCLGFPCRIVHLANLEKAYNGHVIGEVYYENQYGLADFIYGYQFYDEKPISALDVMSNLAVLRNYPEKYRGLFSAIVFIFSFSIGDDLLFFSR